MNLFRFLVFLLLAAGAALGQSTVPSRINYQGQLVDSTGTPLTNGDYVLSFRVYNQNAPGGTLIWGPARFDGVGGAGHGPPATLVNGQFNVVLDVDINNTSLGSALTNNGASYWLEITVGTNNPIAPRQQMLSAPLALKAGNSDQLAGFGWDSVFNNGNPQTGFIPGAKLADGSIGSAKLGPGAVGAGQLGIGVVGPTNIANDSIGTAQIAPGAVTTSELANNAVTTAQIANNAVTSSPIAPGAVGNSQLASNVAVTAAKIAPDSVNTLQLTNGAVTPAKLNFLTGNVAIGQSTAFYPLDILGTLHVSSGGQYAFLPSGSFAIYAGGNMQLYGNMNVNGSISKSSGSFKIDHPLDPENKYLLHSFVESPDMKNIYDGVVVLNSEGEAQVDLPDWFEALNKDFRYQLTAIGGPGPALHIAKEISQNQFKIAGGSPSLKVSWQVTGTRKDAYANAHRIPVEEDKPAELRGFYLHPTEHGRGPEKSIEAAMKLLVAPAEK